MATENQCEEVFGLDTDTPLRCANARGHKFGHSFSVPVKPMAAKEPTVELLVDRFLGRYGEPSRGWERKDLEAFAHALAERAWDEGFRVGADNELAVIRAVEHNKRMPPVPENPYRQPKGPTRNPSCNCIDNTCGYCCGNG